MNELGLAYGKRSTGCSFACRTAGDCEPSDLDVDSSPADMLAETDIKLGLT
jgi:hypothetical protein